MANYSLINVRGFHYKPIGDALRGCICERGQGGGGRGKRSHRLNIERNNCMLFVMYVTRTLTTATQTTTLTNATLTTTALTTATLTTGKLTTAALTT